MRLRPPRLGSLAAFAILALIVGGFTALLYAGTEEAAFVGMGPYLVRIVAFSLVQAGLSTFLSVILGIGLALALARRRFPGRSVALTILGTTMVMPTIVAVFAVLEVYGRSGWAAQLLQTFGWTGSISIFGYPGILIAHVFLNAPFVARILLDALSLVPAEQWRLASSLGFTSGQVFRHLDWPILRGELPGIAGLVFLLCFKSFAIVLALGGGPSRATLEVAIYEALKVDLDFARAAWIALAQIGICLIITLLLQRALRRPPVAATLRSSIPRLDTKDPQLRIFDAFALAVGVVFIAPLALSVLTGLRHIPSVVDADLFAALVTSLAIAAAAATLACFLAVSLANAARSWRVAERSLSFAALYDSIPNVALAVPPFALTAGLYLLLRPFADPVTAGWILLPLLNALAALPFAYRYIAPRLLLAEERYGRLSASLGIDGFARLKIVDWPLLQRPLGSAFALAMALSFGDFGVIALFGSAEFRTLPYMLYERLGAYRFNEASAIGLIILLVAFLLAYLSGRFSHARD